jgi:hypothetical protein
MNNKKLLFFIAAFVCSTTIFAATRTWTGSSNTSWSNSSNWLNGNTPNGSDDVIINADASYYPSLSSNTTVKSLTMNGGSLNMNNRSFTIQNDLVIYSGIFNSGSSSLNIGDDLELRGGTFNANSGDITISDDFLLVSGTYNGSTGDIDADDYFINGGTFNSRGNVIKLNDDFVIDGGSVYISSANFIVEDDLFLISGTLYLNGFDILVQDQINFEGGNLNNVHEIHADRLVLNFSGNLTLDYPIYINNEADFTNGVFNTNSSNLLIFDYNASSTNVSNSSHINGPVRKEIKSTHTNTFTFPIGNGSVAAPLQISSYNQARTGDYFTAQYFYGRNQFAGDSIASSLDHVSQAEYWDLSRAAYSGTPTTDVDVRLYYDESTRSGQVDNASLLRIAHWNGTLWENLGRDNGNSSNNSSAGYTQTSTRATNFSPFTLASSSVLNPLPITLLEFNAYAFNNSVNLNWKTASELNNNFFTIEKSIDGINWTEVNIVASMGNTESVQSYQSTDINPIAGLQFYRLKQTDINGEFTYSAVKSVVFGKTLSNEVKFYPNPTNSILNVHIENEEQVDVELFIYNAFGQEVVHMNGTEIDFHVNMSDYDNGMYSVVINKNGKTFTQKVLKY